MRNLAAIFCSGTLLSLALVQSASALPPQAEARLAAVLAAQPVEVQARFAARNPAATLAYFGIEPGMTVVEALPGAGWYSKILLGYLGEDGMLIGADYAPDMYSLFGFFSEQALLEKETWAEDWPATAREWDEDATTKLDAFVLGSVPERLQGSADAVLFIRALHNLANFDAQGGFLGDAVQSAWDVLKTGGIVGVVQHEARADMPDEWASGAAGYLKREAVIAAFTAVGFEFVGSSEVNANPQDQPTTEDTVWRLPPNFRTSRDDAERRAAFEAMGESHRMTLKFRKPAR